MRFILRKSPLLLLLFALSFAFFSCEDDFNEEVAPEITTEEEMPEMAFFALPPDTESTDPAEARRRPCFTFVFPVELVLRDGSIITTNDGRELRQAIRRIRTTRLRANFVYPFSVELANGSTLSVETFLTFRRLVRQCRDLDRPERTQCITINYPIDVTLRDSVISVGNALQLRRVLQGSPRNGASIVYPIQLTYTESGEVVTANNARELRDLRHDCFQRGEDDDRGESCYRVLFPIDLTIGNRTITVVNREEWLVTVRRFRARLPVSISYPITLIERDGEEETVINSREEWADARAACVD